MKVRSRRLRFSGVKPVVAVLVLSGLFVLVLPRLGSWVLQQFRGQTLSTNPKFESAYTAVLQVSEDATGYGQGRFSSYGISQLDYDAWRQINGKAVKDITDIQADEVKAIYWSRWQKGDCDRYESPLDLACLDSVVSFGVQQSRRFWANLPDDPEQAALEVVNRREGFRRQQLRPPLTPSKQIALRDGLERDRALADLIAAADLPEAPPDGQSSQRSEADLSANEIYSKIKPSTVEVWNNSDFGMPSIASGIILSAEGLVLTNHHVIEREMNPTVKLADGRRFNGRVISLDPELDLALIQLNGAQDLPVTPLADNSEQIQVGDTVYAIGSPQGKGWQLSTSQVIELQSTCANGMSPLRCIRTPNGFLYPGNSGGPLIDSSGQVIGLNRAVQQSTGEGVSIPVETIRDFLNQRMGHPQPMLPIGQPRRWL